MIDDIDEIVRRLRLDDALRDIEALRYRNLLRDRVIELTQRAEAAEKEVQRLNEALRERRAILGEPSPPESPA